MIEDGVSTPAGVSKAVASDAVDPQRVSQSYVLACSASCSLLRRVSSEVCGRRDPETFRGPEADQAEAGVRFCHSPQGLAEDPEWQKSAGASSPLAVVGLGLTAEQAARHDRGLL